MGHMAFLLHLTPHISMNLAYVCPTKVFLCLLIGKHFSKKYLLLIFFCFGRFPVFLFTYFKWTPYWNMNRLNYRSKVCLFYFNILTDFDKDRYKFYFDTFKPFSKFCTYFQDTLYKQNSNLLLHNKFIII